MGLAAGLDATAALLGAAVLCGQLSVGWSNDAIDAPLDSAARRPDKPIALGHVSRRLVAACVTKRCVLSELSLDEFIAEHPAFDTSIYDALDMETAVERRDLPGGPARARVEAAIVELTERLHARGVSLDEVAAGTGARDSVVIGKAAR